MDGGLKRVLDYKLVFDCLSDGSNGMVSLHILAARWPRAEELEGHKIPNGCLEEWRSRADQDGYLDWESFSMGLSTALKKDSTRLQNMADTQTVAERRRPNLLQASEGHGPGAWLLSHPVEGREIEGFLSGCDGEVLVQALTRTKKEMYRCQRNLQHMEQEAAAKQSQPKSELVDSGETVQSGGGMALGDEREELQKGLEILERTRQWFNHRLGQLALEKSSNKKFGTEELLAIMKGSKPPSSSFSPADQTLHHLQQINTHLSSLARTAPTLLSDQPTQHSRRERASREHKRLQSDPGPATPTRGHKGHRHTHTSPPGESPPTTLSGAHVVGMDIPSSPTSPPTSDAVSPPRRSNSMKEIRDHAPSSSRRVLAFSTDGGVVPPPPRGGEAAEERLGKHRHRPRRSNSLTYHSSSSSQDLNVDAAPQYASGGGGQSGKVKGFTVQGSAHQYPLRETVSLTQLPGGGGVASGRPPHPHHPGGMAGSSTMPSGKSMSMRNIPSSQQRDSHATFHTDKLKASRKDRTPGFGGSLEILPSYPARSKKDNLKAKQVAAHQRILMMEQYQGQSAV